MRIIFKKSKQNRNSIAALVGSIELLGVEIFIEEFPETKILSDEVCIIAYSFMTGKIIEIKNEVKKLRKKFKNKIILVAGGPHPSGAPEQTLKVGFDYVFIGESEKSFPDFIKRIKNGSDISDLEGIAYMENKILHINKAKRFIDLDIYPPFSVKYNLFAPIEITRGCPYQCKFCQTPKIFGTKLRHRSISCILKYVQGKNIRFITPNALSYGSSGNPDKDKIEMLLSAVKNKGAGIFFGSFPSEIRPEHLTLEMAELLKKYVSNKNLIIGVQTGSNKLLKQIERGHTIEDCYKAAENAKSSGFTPICDFMFGLPKETEEDIELTKNAMKELIKIGAKIRGHTFMPLPGTDFENEQPGKISDEFRRFLLTLERNGKMEGYWKQQEKINS